MIVEVTGATQKSVPFSMHKIRTHFSAFFAIELGSVPSSDKDNGNESVESQLQV